MKLNAVLFLQNTLLVFGQLQRPWTSRDCQEVGKSFTPWLVLQQGFLSLSSTVCNFCRFRSLTFLGDDRREKAPEGTPLGWSSSSVSCHYLSTFCCLGSLTSLGGDKWKGGGADEGKHG